MTVCLHHDHRDGDFPPDPLGHRPPEQTPQYSPALVSHHDEVSALFPSDANDHINSFASCHYGADAVVIAWRYHGCEPPLRLLDEIAVNEPLVHRKEGDA